MIKVIGADFRYQDRRYSSSTITFDMTGTVAPSNRSPHHSTIAELLANRLGPATYRCRIRVYFVQLVFIAQEHGPFTL